MVWRTEIIDVHFFSGTRETGRINARYFDNAFNARRIYKIIKYI